MCAIKTLKVKDFKEEELYKKCGFKKADGFKVQTEWKVKMGDTKYGIKMYAKEEGKANMENKYEFPPPVDKKLYFGSCALVGCVIDESNNRVNTPLSLELWAKIHERLFGGFHDLVATKQMDEKEPDELAHIPKHKKTKVGGYLKDGFVVDRVEYDNDDTDDSEGSGEGSELIEDMYDYSDTDSDNDNDKKK